MRYKFQSVILSILSIILILSVASISQVSAKDAELDKKVQEFLNERRGTWRDLNVPASDGKLLHDIIVKNNYKNALEIGTSTGHSAIWIAWALSKTGGKLITIEIDKQRHKEALENFKAAGLDHIIDARLADAHQLVKELKGPFDFVFSDADKGWYKNYFIDVEPNLIVGGCFTAHNVYENRRRGGGTAEYLNYVKSLSNYQTEVDESGNGLAISYKKSK